MNSILGLELFILWGQIQYFIPPFAGKVTTDPMFDLLIPNMWVHSFPYHQQPGTWLAVNFFCFMKSVCRCIWFLVELNFMPRFSTNRQRHLIPYPNGESMTKFSFDGVSDQFLLFRKLSWPFSSLLLFIGHDPDHSSSRLTNG